MVISLIAVPVAYWLISPLFIDKVVNEPLKNDAIMTSLTQQIDDPQTMNEFTEEMEKTDQSVEETEAIPYTSETYTLASGTFVDVAHEGTGDVQIIDLGSGEKILRFENLDVLNGPDLRVLLSKSTNVEKSSDLGEYIELGKLKGNQGNQNYDIPDNVDVSLYNTVIIYCKPFHVVFNVAVLNR